MYICPVRTLSLCFPMFLFFPPLVFFPVWGLWLQFTVWSSYSPPWTSHEQLHWISLWPIAVCVFYIFILTAYLCDTLPCYVISLQIFTCSGFLLDPGTTLDRLQLILLHLCIMWYCPVLDGLVWDSVLPYLDH